MKRCRLFAVCTVAVAAVSVLSGTVAAQLPPSQFEHVKGLESFIGSWSGDAPGGSGVKLAMECRWAANKSYAEFGISVENGDEWTNIGTVFVGRNPKGEGFRVHGFWPDRVIQGEGSMDGNKLSYHAAGDTWDGLSTSADVTYEVDGDEFTVTASNIKRGEWSMPKFSMTIKRQ